MKRIITFLLLLAAVFVSTTSWAQSLFVGDVRVDLDATTTQTITGNNIQGKVTYSPSSKTLYLEDATINGSIYGTDLGSSASTRYYIYLKGLNTINPIKQGIRFANSYVVLYGATGAQLQINSEASNSDFSCISTEDGHFEVWSVRLTMFGASKGFYGSPGSATLEFVNSIVSVDCDAGAIYGFKSVYYDDCLCTDNLKFQSGTGYLNEYDQLASAFHVWPLLVVGEEPVRTASDTRTGSRYSWKWTKSEKKLEITGDISTRAYSTIANYGIEGLTIVSNDNYTLTSSNITVGVDKKTTISGSGRLNITSTAGNAIVARADVDVMIRELNVQGKLHGFTDLHGGHKLTLKKLNDNSDYRFAGTSNACLCVSNLEMDDMDICTSETWWNPNDGYAYYSDNIYKSASTSSDNGCVCFKSTSKISYYDLIVGDKQIRQNCSRITGPFLTSGSMVYDTSSKTLTVTDATLAAKKCISNNIDGLTIKLVGDNTITSYSDEGYVIGSSRSFSITGDGTLNGISRGEADGLLLNNSITCTIDGPQVEFRTGEGCCLLDWQSLATLNVKGSTTQVTFSPAEDKAIWSLASLVMGSNIGILEPAGGWFSSSLKSITTDGTSAYQGKVVIGQIVDYGLYISETPVTSANADDILGDGTFSYDPSTKVLTVTNATVTNTSGALGSIISNREIRGLGIELVGDNTFTSRMASIDTKQSLSITGDGTLKCTSTEDAGLYLWGDGITCYIMDPQVVFAGTYGLIDWTGKSKLFVIGSSTHVTFEPTYEAIYNLKSLILDNGFNIIEPEGGYFHSLLKSVTVDGETAYMGRVVIGKQAQGDLNGDSKVDIADAVTVLNIMASGVYDSAADLNNDTKVDIADFVTVLNIMAAQ